ncbi:MAG TPA: Ig-like domain-containing protein, partial [Acidobacteriaceae bacterium]|nr:Ig-like domain-containing protein [Acidobacteriaceae bacterium]
MRTVRALLFCTSAFTLASLLAGCGSTTVAGFNGGSGNPSSQATAPTVAAVAEQTNGVAPNRKQEVQFSEPMAADTINAQTFVVTDASGKAVPGVVSYDSDFNLASFQPNPALATGATYNVTITTGVKSAQGVAMAANYTYSFATRAETDESPLTVEVVSPTPNTDCVAVSSDITITFNEEPDAATVNSKTIAITGPGGAMIPATLSMDVSKTVVTATPSSALPQGTITVTVSGVADLADVAMTAPYTWTFSTGCNTGGGNGGSGGSGGGGTGGSTNPAFVYVASGETSMGTPYEINEFVAHADGTLTQLPGSPLSIAGAPDKMIANGSYLFVPESGTYVVSYAINSDGTLTPAATTNSSQDDNPTGEGGPVATFLDRSGQTVYTNSAFAYQGNSRYLTYAVRAGGTLAFQGMESYGDPQDPRL